MLRFAVQRAHGAIARPADVIRAARGQVVGRASLATSATAPALRHRVAWAAKLAGGGLLALVAARGAQIAWFDLAAAAPSVDAATVAGATATTLLEQSEGAAAHSRRRLLERAFWLLWSFSLVFLLSPAAILSPVFREKVFYRALYEAIVYSRSAALAKWSQWASVRLDLLPVTLCRYLARLQADAPKHSLAHTLQELEAAGLRIDEDDPKALSQLDPEPMASGSIAQVHRASFQGERVVVKVRHPRVGEELLLDFEILRSAASFVHDWVPALRWINAPGTLSQFEAAMAGQCDLQQEARHLELFSFNFRRKIAWMNFPRVFFATPAVLVESFEEGELVQKFVARGLEVPRAEAHFCVARGEDIYLQMLLVDNFMHADLHPGNIVFRRSGLMGKPHLVLLDGGMAAFLTSDERKNFIGLLQAIGDGDGLAVANSVLSLSRRDCDNKVGFRRDISEMCAQNCQGYGTDVNLGEVIRGLMQLMYKHSVPIDGNYSTLIANMLCLDGMARELEPKFNLLDVGYPLLRSHQLLGDQTFQTIFKAAQHFVPLTIWEMTYRLSLHAAMHGKSLKRFQI